MWFPALQWENPHPQKTKAWRVNVKHNTIILHDATVRQSVMQGELNEDHIVLDLSEVFVFWTDWLFLLQLAWSARRSISSLPPLVILFTSGPASRSSSFFSTSCNIDCVDLLFSQVACLLLLLFARVANDTVLWFWPPPASISVNSGSPTTH